MHSILRQHNVVFSPKLNQKLFPQLHLYLKNYQNKLWISKTNVNATSAFMEMVLNLSDISVNYVKCKPLLKIKSNNFTITQLDIQPLIMEKTTKIIMYRMNCVAMQTCTWERRLVHCWTRTRQRDDRSTALWSTCVTTQRMFASSVPWWAEYEKRLFANITANFFWARTYLSIWNILFMAPRFGLFYRKFTSYVS